MEVRESPLALARFLRGQKSHIPVVPVGTCKVWISSLTNAYTKQKRRIRNLMEMTDRSDKIGPSRICVKYLIIISGDMRHVYRPRWEIINPVRRMKKANEALNYQVHPSPKIGK